MPQLARGSVCLEPERMVGGHSRAAQKPHQEIRAMARVRAWGILTSVDAHALSKAAELLLRNDDDEL